MSTCVSVHKDAVFVLKLRLSFGSKTDNKLVIPPFPVKEDKFSSNGDRPIVDLPLISQWSPSDATTNATSQLIATRTKAADKNSVGRAIFLLICQTGEKIDEILLLDL
ncbi:hypothetical protein FF1_002083 [Malus domestica]